jgi:hypothetical protein
MANEFVIKNGYFSQGNSNITGSLTVSASNNSVFIGTGNVGIGSASPGYKLSVQTSEPTYGIVQAISNNNGGNATSGSKILWDQSGIGNFWEGMPGGVNAWAIGLYNGSTNPEYLRIGSTGNVGIGTTSPSAKLHVSGGIISTDTIAITKGASDTIQAGSSIYLIGNSGSSYTQLQQGVGRFTIWGYNGSAWGEKFTIDNTSGNVGIGTATPTQKLTVATGSITADNYYFNNQNTTVAKRVSSTVSGISNAGYTTICNVDGDSLASGIRISLMGTTTAVVINTVADILVNHSQDIYVESKSGIYTLLTLKIISNNDESFTIQATTDSANAVTLNVEVFPLNSETIIFNPSSIYTGTTLIHPCIPGLNISATGGGDPSMDGSLSVSGRIGIGTTSPTTILHLNGTGSTITLTETAYGRTSQIGYTDGANLRLDNDSASHTFIGKYNNLFLSHNGGNVRIGDTTSPSHKLEVSGSALVDQFKYTRAINISNTDLNSLTTAGFYDGYSLTNAPNIGWFYITVERHIYDTNWVHQTATSFGSENTENITYSRVRNSGTWSNWKELVGTNITTGVTAISTGSLSVPGDISMRHGYDSFRATGYAYSKLLETGYDGTRNQDFLKIYTAGNGTGNANPQITVFRDTGVGIGTTSPNAKLDVNGNTIISGSLSNGLSVIASGLYSHAEGYYTTASGQYSHTEGAGYVISGEGTFYYPVIASGYASHAEGYGTKARATGSHSEGESTTADGQGSHAEGGGSWASGSWSHAEGHDTQARGPYSHTEGYATSTYGYYSHAEGHGTIASASAAHAEGYLTRASGSFSHAEGYFSEAWGDGSHAEGSQTIASGSYSHTEGTGSIARGQYSHAEGENTLASGTSAHSEGERTTASGIYSHTEGSNTLASGIFSHAEGFASTASGTFACHAEGYGSLAAGSYSHAEGQGTIASGNGSHAEGYYTTTTEYSIYSHAAGYYTVASGSYQSVVGQYNRSSSVASAFIIGNGTNDSARSNLVFASGSTFQVTGSILATGNVGFGTSTPTLRNINYSGLHIHNQVSAAANGTSLKLTNSVTGQGQFDGLELFVDNTGASSIMNRESTALILGTGGIERMRVTSFGSCSFGGNTSPVHQLQLSVDSAGKPSTSTWTITSDSRIKENIIEADYDICYDIVKNLPLKRYTWKQEAYTYDQVRDRSKLGWIAQDVETVFPKAVEIFQFSGSGDFHIDDCRNLNSDQIYAAMYGTIKKLISENDILKSEIQAIKTHIGL